MNKQEALEILKDVIMVPAGKSWTLGSNSIEAVKIAIQSLETTLMPNAIVKCEDTCDKVRPNLDTEARFKKVIFYSKREAEEILDWMANRIEYYGDVSIHDLYDLTGQKSVIEDYMNGWTNLKSATITRSPYQLTYILDLPFPIKLPSPKNNNEIDKNSAYGLNRTNPENMATPYGKYLADFARIHGISIEDASKHPMCKARLEYFSKTGL